MLCFQNLSALSGNEECGTTYGVSPGDGWWAMARGKSKTFPLWLLWWQCCHALCLHRVR